jgi:hypothetical protein
MFFKLALMLVIASLWMTLRIRRDSDRAGLERQVEEQLRALRNHLFTTGR